MKKPIRQRPGLMEYLQRRLGTFTGNGPEYKFWCFVCIDRLGDESSKRKLTFNAQKVAFHCWRCGFATRSLERFFRTLNGGVLRIDELPLIRGEVYAPGKKLHTAVLEILYESTEAKKLRPVQLPPEMAALTSCKWDGPPIRVKRGIQYLRSRGIGPASVHKYGIGYCPTGRYAQRLVFPVFQGGDQVYFTTRYAGPHERKALNPPFEEGHFSSSTCLLNYDNVVGAEVVAIVEGPFDMMAHAHAVGLIGKEISDAQVVLIESLAKFGTKEFIVSLDAEAVRDAEKVCLRINKRVPKVTVLRLDDGDPHDRRAELPALLEQRGSMTTNDRVRGRLAQAPRRKYGFRVDNYRRGR